MITLKQKRLYLDNCTISHWSMPGFFCLGLELPWLDNERNKSCIPEGLYEVEMYMSPSRVIIVPQFVTVPNRTNIQIHPGNYTSQILGCQLPGDGVKDINGDGVLDVTNSGNAFKRLMSKLPESFFVEVYS